MIDFSTLQGLTIPVDRMRATLKRGVNYTGAVVHAWIVVDGQTYYAEETPTDIPVKAGATITCFVTTGVQVNGQYVFQGSGSYEYTVSSNTTIEITNAHISDTQYIGLILITETPVTGVVTQIADASGRVLWSSTIKFTINGDTYIADRGMTWAEWFASDYNTTGETEGDIKDANGNEVSMDAVIVGGTAYEVGFSVPVTVELTALNQEGASYDYAWIIIDGVKHSLVEVANASGKTIVVPSGTVIHCYIIDMCYRNGTKQGSITLNGTDVSVADTSGTADFYYAYTIEGDASIFMYNTQKKDNYGSYRKLGKIQITTT